MLLGRQTLKKRSKDLGRRGGNAGGGGGGGDGGGGGTPPPYCFVVGRFANLD